MSRKLCWAVILSLSKDDATKAADASKKPMLVVGSTMRAAAVRWASKRLANETAYRAPASELESTILTMSLNDIAPSYGSHPMSRILMLQALHVEEASFFGTILKLFSVGVPPEPEPVPAKLFVA